MTKHNPEKPKLGKSKAQQQQATQTKENEEEESEVLVQSVCEFVQERWCLNREVRLCAKGKVTNDDLCSEYHKHRAIEDSNRKLGRAGQADAEALKVKGSAA